MANELRDLLMGAADAKARLFATEDFAGGYGRSVVGRVKRRRTVTATAMGGGTVAAVGALAVGAVSLPRVSAALGFAPSVGGDVVCSTTTPHDADGVRTWGSLAPLSDGESDIASFPDSHVSFRYADGELAIVDELTGEVTKVNLIASPGPVVVDQGIGYLRQHEDGTYSVPLSEGRVVALRVVPYEKPKDAEVITLEYRYPSVDVALDGPHEPVVTCITATPAPTDGSSSSVAPTASPAISADPSATPDPSAVDDLGAPTSPFQCGFEFPDDRRETEALSIVGGLTTAADVRATLLEWYGEQTPTTEVADTNVPAYRVSVDFDVIGYEGGVLDPGQVPEFDKAFGITFVAVRDGAVVGTIAPESDGMTYGMVNVTDGEPGPVQAFLWDRAAFTTCGGASVEDANIYAVAGAKSGESVDYAWAWMTQ